MQWVSMSTADTSSCSRSSSTAASCFAAALKILRRPGSSRPPLAALQGASPAHQKRMPCTDINRSLQVVESAGKKCVKPKSSRKQKQHSLDACSTVAKNAKTKTPAAAAVDTRRFLQQRQNLAG